MAKCFDDVVFLRDGFREASRLMEGRVQIGDRVQVTNPDSPVPNRELCLVMRIFDIEGSRFLDLLHESGTPYVSIPNVDVEILFPSDSISCAFRDNIHLWDNSLAGASECGEFLLILSDMMQDVSNPHADAIRDHGYWLLGGSCPIDKLTPWYTNDER